MNGLPPNLMADYRDDYRASYDSYGVPPLPLGYGDMSRQAGGPMPPNMYLGTLLVEREKLEPFRDILAVCSKLLEDEIQRVKGEIGLKLAPMPLGGSPLGGIMGRPPPTRYDEPPIAPMPPLMLEMTQPKKVAHPPPNSVKKTKKVFVPVDKYPGFNFVGRILGPRGSTLKRLEDESGCKVMVRGHGCLRTQEEEDSKKDKPGWDHLSEPLHVALTVELPEEQADEALQNGTELVNALLIPPSSADGMDEVKRSQLRELAAMKDQQQQQQLLDQRQVFSHPSYYGGARGPSFPPEPYGRNPALRGPPYDDYSARYNSSLPNNKRPRR